MFQFLKGFKIILMNVKNQPILIILLYSSPVWGQLRDTNLFSMSSRPFFYNVVKGQNGRIYAGTAEGVYQFDGATMSKLDDRIGYLTLNAKGKPTIDPNGIKYHEQTSFVRMLPFPNERRDEYHAGTADFFYITSAGKMHVYEILPYHIRYRNHSVRTASQNFVGTYSGIYYKGRKLENATTSFPRFTDGRIRELNGKVFVCYSSLFIADMHQGDSLPTYWKQLPKGFHFDWATDILYSAYYKKYLLSGKTDLVIIDSALTEAKSVYKSKDKDTDVILLGENRGSVYFASGRDFIALNPLTKQIKFQQKLPEHILDGHISNLNNYLLSNQALYVVHADGSTKKLTDLNKAHTLQHLSGSDYVISTDAGLFRYNTASNKLSELIQGVEFNRRGLYLEGDSLFAGSINGLYVFDTRYLEQLSDRIANVNRKQSLPAYILQLMIGLAFITALLSYLLYRSRRNLKRAIAESGITSPPKITREDIEAFIQEHLAQASLKSIAEKFKTSNANIYALLSPEKPGALINRLRMEQVHKLRSENKTAREISQRTGFSEYYVRKVWNKKG
jgi:hypothetical protein